MKHELEIELCKTLNDLFPELVSPTRVELVSNSNKDFGDYTSTIAFQLAAKLSIPATVIAKKIVASWGGDQSKVEIKSCDLGYINFILTPNVKLQILLKLLDLDIDKLKMSFFTHTPQDFKSVQDFRHALVSHVLVNLMGYTHFKDENALLNLKVGQCASSLRTAQLGFASLKFSCLATPIIQDWALCDEDDFQTIKYAYERTHHVLGYLTTNCVEKQNSESVLLSFTPDELFLFNALIEFDNVLFIASKNLCPSQLCKYIKNLARTIHYLYNKMTLVNGDTHKDFAIRCLLQAAQSVLSLSLQLLGVE